MAKGGFPGRRASRRGASVPSRRPRPHARRDRLCRRLRSELLPRLMTARLTVLGGSSPSTLALINGLAAVGGSPFFAELTLHGCDVDHLGAVERYARTRFA